MDQMGNTHRWKQKPMRIVSLVPSQTETLVELGLEEQIVGVTKFCVHPFHLKSTKTIVGGTKKVHFDKIKALEPDIIIANKEENTLEIVKELQQICPVWVTDVVDFDSNIQMIQDFGQIFQKRTDAQKWIDKIQFGYKEFLQYMSVKPERKAAYLIWRDPYMAAGKDTYIHEMLTMNKFMNIYDNRDSRYPEVEIRKMRIQGDPEVVFLSSEPYPFKEEHAFEIGRSTHHAKTVFVDGEMFSWHGVRLFRAFDYFKVLQERLGDE